MAGVEWIRRVLPGCQPGWLAVSALSRVSSRSSSSSLCGRSVCVDDSMIALFFSSPLRSPHPTAIAGERGFRRGKEDDFVARTTGEQVEGEGEGD